jgi:hypothetical protein
VVSIVHYILSFDMPEKVVEEWLPAMPSICGDPPDVSIAGAKGEAKRISIAP